MTVPTAALISPAAATVNAVKKRTPAAGKRLLAATRWLTTPLLPDDYLGLVNPLWSTRAGRGTLPDVVLAHSAPPRTSFSARNCARWQTVSRPSACMSTTPGPAEPTDGSPCMTWSASVLIGLTDRLGPVVPRDYWTTSSGTGTTQRSPGSCTSNASVRRRPPEARAAGCGSSAAAREENSSRPACRRQPAPSNSICRGNPNGHQDRAPD